MSRWMDIAREVKAEGEKKRGDFSPRPGSYPDRAYKYWARYANRVPARENFCHFWRVVVFWSVLMHVRRFLVRNGSWLLGAAGIVGCIVMTIIVVWTIVSAPSTDLVLLYLLGGAAAIIYIAVGIMMGLYMGNDLADEKHERVLFWVTLPISIWFASIAWFFRSRVGLFIRHWFPRALLTAIIGLVVLSLGVMCYSLVANLGIAGFYVIGLIAAFFTTVGYVVRNGGDWVAGWRARQEAAADARLQAWMDAQEAAGWPLESTAVAKPRKTTWVGRRLRGLGDMLILVGQIIRVNKWKVCPYVTITDERDVAHG